MRWSLKRKFYILVLPSVVVLIALMAMVMLPHQQVQNNVVQIKEAMDEAVSAETFARFYERQLREAAAFIVTGQPEHQRLYEQSKEQARIGIADWLAAENRHTGDSPAEHATELKMLHATLAGNADVAKAADWSIALAGSGQRAQAMENLQKAITGDGGETVSNNVDDQLPDEEAQLNKYLDNLAGAIKSMVVMRLMNLGPNVDSMKTHFANTIYAERFARYYNMQVRQVMAQIVAASSSGQDLLGESGDQASEALQAWSDEARMVGADKERGRQTALVGRLTSTYKSVSTAVDNAVTAVNAGNPAAAIAYIEKETGPTPLTSLTAAISTDVNNQKKDMQLDASLISSGSSNAAWGVGIIGGLLLLVALGGTFLVSGRVVTPVVQLRDAARAFGEGGGNVSVDVKSHDELGELSTSFNEMAAARIMAEEELRQARDELEDRVEERTSQLARANRELGRVNHELLSTNKELNDFAYVVSHDLKAPLRGIGSLATWLSTDYRDVLDENGQKQLELLLDRAKRMEGLIESILAYSRVGRVREERETVDLDELVDAAVKMLDIPEGIEVKVAGDLPEVTGERTRLGQVFGNLIGNAVKFMDKPEGKVIISCADDGDFWRLAVADSGPGIDARYHDQIFQIFQTLSARDDVESSGVGLTLVKKIVEMHGGRVWLESEVGKGSTFFFTLPKAK